jgi:hypothetical protein
MLKIVDLGLYNTIFMKRILVHREGQSGHFFLALLEKFDLELIKFRIPDYLMSNTYNLEITHEVDYARHITQFDQVLRILPTKKIYHAIYNNFMKKLIVEQTNLNFLAWRDNPALWYDICFYNINEYHAMIVDDVEKNQYKEIINFDHMLDHQYLDWVLSTYFDQCMDKERVEVLNNYKKMQLQLDLDNAEVSMQDIANTVPDELFELNPWFFSYCIYKYEKNNNLAESARQWSINNITGIQTKYDLLTIAECY